MGVSVPLETAIDVLYERILNLRETLPSGRRGIIAFAGIPGSGKSTISLGLLARLLNQGVEDVAVLPMVSNPESEATYII
jgi:putative protein kinase ArgK-like GTPase of G3E family